MIMWQIVGTFLLLWVIFDLMAGYTYLHRKISRRQEAALYWSVLGLWLLIAVYTLGLL